jgi:hypothetical protein
MALFGAGSRSQQPNRLGTIQVGTSEYGVVKPIGWGNFKVPIKLLDFQDFTSVPQSAGGKGGDTSSYEYYAAVVALLCKGPIGGMGNLYDGGGAGALLAATEYYTIPPGGGTYEVENEGVAAYYYDEGVTYQVDYSISANDFGSDGSITLSGAQPAPFEKTSEGEFPTPPTLPLTYAVNNNGLYYFPAASAGITVAITYTYTTADTSNDAITVGNNPRSPILRYAIGVINGTVGQSPWDYMLTNHPANALRYDGQALLVSQNMDLGSTATVPNLSAEILNGRLKSFGTGVSDCDPAAVLTDLLTASDLCNWPWLGDLTNYSNFCVANNLFISPFYDSARKVTEMVQEICDLTNAEAVWSGQALKIVPYGDTTAVGNGRTYTPQTEPIYEIDEDQMICADGDDAVRLAWQDLADNYNRVQLEYTSRNDSYNTALIHEQDEASILANGLLSMQAITAHHYNVQLYAAIAMNMLLRRNSTPLRLYDFTLPWYFQLAEPMDILLLNLEVGNLGVTAARVVSVEEQDDYSLKFEVEDFLYGVSEGVVYPKGAPSGTAPGAHDAPGNTNLFAAFQPNARVTGGDVQLWLALGGGPAWGGCRVWLSLDNVSYGPSAIGTQYGPARAGTLTAALPATADPDTTDTAEVTVIGSLATVTQAQADALVTLCLLGTELISYETAALTGSTVSSNSYGLTYLRRGVFGTRVLAHVAGESFVRLDDSIFKYVVDPTLSGKTVWLKFTSFNLYDQEEQSLAEVTGIQVTLGGAPSNMGVSSFLNSDGTDATVQVFQGSPLLGGSYMTANGASVSLPAQSFTPLLCSQFYAVNFNLTTSAYVLYTDPNAWLADQSIGMIAIGTVTTPASGSAFYVPTSYTDAGLFPTSNPAGAYTSAQTAVVNSRCTGVHGFASNGYCSWQGFSGVITAAKTLSVTAVLAISGSGTSSQYVQYTLDGTTFVDMVNSTGNIASATYTATVPSGSDLSTVRVVASSSSAAGAQSATITISDIGIA